MQPPSYLSCPREYFDVLTDELDDPKDAEAEKDAEQRRAENLCDLRREEDDSE